MNEIRNRYTGKVMLSGLSLKIVIEKHKRWVVGENGGIRANLRDADLRGADLRGANLRGADLSDADLCGADLSDAPFRIENIHQKVYNAASEKGALNMNKWHSCDTTHCRAGWVVTLAGEGGKALEWVYGTPAAAALIYIASDPDIGKMPDFYCGNEDALADMKDRAEKEATKTSKEGV